MNEQTKGHVSGGKCPLSHLGDDSPSSVALTFSSSLPNPLSLLLTSTTFYVRRTACLNLSLLLFRLLLLPSDCRLLTTRSLHTFPASTPPPFQLRAFTFLPPSLPPSIPFIRCCLILKSSTSPTSHLPLVPLFV